MSPVTADARRVQINLDFSAQVPARVIYRRGVLQSHSHGEREALIRPSQSPLSLPNV